MPSAGQRKTSATAGFSNPARAWAAVAPTEEDPHLPGGLAPFGQRSSSIGSIGKLRVVAADLVMEALGVLAADEAPNGLFRLGTDDGIGEHGASPS
jgi:hypothetical protein